MSSSGLASAGCVVLLSELLFLAASRQNKCRSLVCSCYRHKNNKNNDNISNSGFTPKVNINNIADHQSERHVRSSRNMARGDGTLVSAPPLLKSNLKKTTEVQMRRGCRKVSWPDDHGKDIAHIQEIESSDIEDMELEGVRNSCICVIQ